MQNIQYEGKTVAFRDMPDGQRFLQVRTQVHEFDVCPLCKQQFTRENTTAIVWVISNQAGVPNRFLHKECLCDKTLEYAFRLIAEDWKAAQQYRDWF